MKQNNKSPNNELKQNVNDIKTFYNFLNHKTKTVFQVFKASINKETTDSPTIPTKQYFIPHNDLDMLLRLCKKYQFSGQICLGINERPNEQTKITDILSKLNVILFDIDIIKDKKENGISPENLKKEAYIVMKQCEKKLIELGFNINMTIDSGNGYHIYIKIYLDIPKYITKKEFEESAIYKQLIFLENQLREFNTKNVIIDFLSKDIMRRVKIPGTYNIKRYKDNDDNLYKMMSKEQWRIAKILYINKTIDENKNNEIFTKLPINDTKKDEQKKQNKFELLLKINDKLKKLYTGKRNKEFTSRSEAEITLVNKLFRNNFNETEIYTIMDKCKIGKWQESTNSYKKLTIKKANVFVQKSKKLDKDIRENLHDLFENETETSSTYKRYGKEMETKAFKEWISRKERIKIKEKLQKEEIKQIIPFNDSDILLKENGVLELKIYTTYKGNAKTKEFLILDGKLEILSKTTDNLNIDLYTFYFKNKKYDTLSVNHILKKFNSHLYNRSHGQDIIKRVFNYMDKQLKITKPEYVVGFNNGWKLPQLEKEKGFSLITYTDFQKITYEKTKNIIKEYQEQEKINICQKLKNLIEITQTDPIKLAIIIGWSIASVFRLPIIKHINIFHILYLIGKRATGKTPLEDIFIIKFFNVYDNILSPVTLTSTSRFEDHLTQSTFPHVIGEIHQIKNPEALPILKQHATYSDYFERKKSALELEFRKLKTSAICLDSNYIIKKLRDPASNSKMIVIKFLKIIIKDQIWINLARELKKENLFSFIFEFTKEWENKVVFNLLDKIERDIEKYYQNLTDNTFFDKIKKNYSRTLDAFKIIIFGLNIFEKSFDIYLEKIDFKYNPGVFLKMDILDHLLKTTQIITSDLMEQFYTFCIQAIKYEESYEDDNGVFRRGNNPKYITCKLEKSKDNIHRAFTQDNLRDFNEYTKEKHNLEALSYELQDAITNKENIIYSNCKPFKNKKQMRVILINEEWFR
ncbi:hypothetical protein ES702_03441 [subsurface metagenome]